MEKDGPVDQVLLAVLGFLAHPALGMSVVFVGALLVAYLGRIRPGHDWAPIKEWPGAVLGGAALLLAGLRGAPRYVSPEYDFTCTKILGDFGVPRTTDCAFDVTSPGRLEYDYTFGEYVWDFFVSLVQEGVVGALGVGAGVLVSRV